MLRARRAIKQLQRRLRNEPENVALRIKLAGALNEADRKDEAIAMYREVAVAYQGQGRLSQAAAVCRSALEIDPDRGEIRELLQSLEEARAAQHEGEATIVRDERYSLPSLSPPPPGRDSSRSRRPSAAGRRPSAEGRSSARGASPPGSRASAEDRSSVGARRADSSGSAASAPGGSPPSAVSMGGPPEPDEEPTPWRSSPVGAAKESQSRPPGVPGPPGEPPRPVSSESIPIAEDAPSDAPPEGPARASGREKPPPASPSRPFGAWPRGGAGRDLEGPEQDFEDAATRVAGDEAGARSRWSDAPTPAPTPSQRPDTGPDERGDTGRFFGSGPGFDPASDPDSGPTSAPASASWGAFGGPPAEPPDARAPESGEHDFGEGEASTRVFGPSFRAALEGLAPDGSAIDVPLGVFSDLPGDVLDQFIRGMSLRTAEPGEILVREGEIGDACFVLASGEVRVLKREPTEPHGAPIEVARLGEGAVFGEFALLADRRRHATVEVVDRAELFEVPRRLASELAASHPEVRPALEKFYRERLLSTLITTTPLFERLPTERRADVLAHFQPRRSESGEAIVREGEHTGGLYLIVLGQVEITKRVSNQRSVLVATLGEGAYFGEMSLLQGEPASASVTATGPTELAVLSADSFYEIVADYPVLWEAMKREAGKRDLENHRIVTGNTSVV